MKKFSFVLSKVTLTIPRVIEIHADSEENARSLLTENVIAFGEVDNLDTIEIAADPS